MPRDRSMLPAYRAVLFDFFGTLTHAVRRGPAHATIAAQLGCDPTDFSAALDATFRSRACGTPSSTVAALRCLARSVGSRPSRRQLKVAAAARTGAVLADTRLRSDAVPVLEAVRRLQLRTAVITDCTHELPELMPGLPVADLLDTCVYSVRLGTCKPDPRMYLTACRRLRVAPEECLYIGDGGSRELSGAQALGMDVVQLSAPDLAGHLVFDRDTNWHGPRITSLGDLLPLVEAGAYGRHEAAADVRAEPIRTRTTAAISRRVRHGLRFPRRGVAAA